MTSLKTGSCGLKIINVFFHKGRTHSRLKRGKFKILELTGYQQAFSKAGKEKD